MSAQHAFAPEHGQFVGQQDLQVADRAFLRVVTARVAIEAGAALGRHADEVAELVQQRMQRRVGAHVQFVAAQSGLALAPVGAGQRLIRGQLAQLTP